MTSTPTWRRPMAVHRPPMPPPTMITLLTTTDINVPCNGVEALHHVLPCQGHDLTDTKLARPNHRAVYAGVILVHTNNSLHHFRISLGCVWVKINHDTSLV